MVNVFLYTATIATIILLPTTYAILSKKGPPSLITETCDNDACKRAAFRLLSAIKPEVKPCDNFYQFACGNVAASSYKIKINVKEQIRSLVTEMPTENDPKYLRTMQQAYQLCMDEKKMDDRGAAPGLEFLSKVGAWPVLGNNGPVNWDFVQSKISFWNLGLFEESLTSMTITRDEIDSNRYIIEVDQHNPFIPREYFLYGKNHPKVKEYFEFMVDIAVLFGANIVKAKEHMNKVMDFQTKLAKILKPQCELQRGLTGSYKVYTIQELQDQPENWIDWNKLLDGVMSPWKPLNDQKIAVADLKGFNELGKLIQEFPTEVIADHVMWTAAVVIARFLTSSMRRRVEQFTGSLMGDKKTPERWITCVTEVKENFDLALSSVYVQKILKESSLKIAKDMSSRIQKEMDKELREVEWMDKETRAKAQLKASNILHVIGYPEEMKNKAIIEDYYKELNLVTDRYFESKMEIARWIVNQHKRKLKQTINRRHWTQFGRRLSMDGYYQLSNNAIDIPAGGLQEPFLTPSVPQYINYADIGFFIGHELTHAFDQQGSQYGPEGNLEEWWDKPSLQRFNEKKQCLINQYSSFKESQTGLYVNGDLTQSENIADNGGWKLTYRAYKRLAAELKKPEPKLPGLQKYTNDQLFLISFANVWCSAFPLEQIKHQLRSDPHSPAEWRVNGVLINMPEFEDIFKCDKGTPMNPEKKCEFW